MFTKLGGFECTKPFIVGRLRENKDVALFIGGAAESAYAAPGRYVALFKHRRGFVRLALEERRDILPMWTFGDESLLPQWQDPPAFLGKLLTFLKEASGLLVPPLFSGLPQLPPLTLVTGVPVSLEDLWATEVGGPVSDAAVEEGFRRYMVAQQQLFDRNKGAVAGNHKHAKLEQL